MEISLVLLIIACALGFALGYGVREAVSRYRRARERRKKGYTGL